MSKFDASFEDALAQAEARGRRRVLRTVEPLDGGRVRVDGRVLIDVASTDYLGLSRHPEVIARACAWTQRYGAGAGGSRLLRGTFDAHRAVEAKLARLHGAEAALLFATGWQANASILPALFAAGEGPALVFADRLIHASLHQGCQAAGVRQIRFRHNDLDHLESLLNARAGEPGRRFVITESVFSVDGDRADVVRLADIAERHGAFLYLDEAHATGVLGPGGMGLAGLAPGKVDLVMGAASKALGGFGAYVAGSAVLIDYLINACSGLIYSTATPPAVLGAMDAALDLAPGMDAERTHLHRLGERLRAGLAALGADTAGSSTQIVPAVVGGERATLALAEALRDAGFLVSAIRPPTAPEGKSRLRFSLSAALAEADVEALLAALGQAWPAAQAA